MNVENVVFKELDPSCEVEVAPIQPEDIPRPKNEQKTGLALIIDQEHEPGASLQVDFRFPNNPTTYRALVKVANSEAIDSGAKFRISAYICDLRKVDSADSETFPATDASEQAPTPAQKSSGSGQDPDENSPLLSDKGMNNSTAGK